MFINKSFPSHLTSQLCGFLIYFKSMLMMKISAVLMAFAVVVISFLFFGAPPMSVRFTF